MSEKTGHFDLEDAFKCADDYSWQDPVAGLALELLAKEARELRADNRFLEEIVKETHHGKDFRKYLHWVGGDDGYVAERSRDEVIP